MLAIVAAMASRGRSNQFVDGCYRTSTEYRLTASLDTNGPSTKAERKSASLASEGLSAKFGFAEAALLRRVEII
jgi:hypothetical protein